MGAHKNNKYAQKYSEDDMKIICDSLVDYAANAKSIHLAPWCYKQGHSKSWLSETARHYPQLAEALVTAKELLAAKIVNLSFYDKSVNAYAGIQYLPIYDSDYKDLLKWKAEISKEQIKPPENKCIFNKTMDEAKKD